MKLLVISVNLISATNCGFTHVGLVLVLGIVLKGGFDMISGCILW